MPHNLCERRENMDYLVKIVGEINSIVWGVPMIILLSSTHIFMTIRLKFIQRYIFKGIKITTSSEENSKGEISQFGALATALAATIGTGNIIGVSTAIALGGSGAVFWTWMTGLFGMATKYAESILSLSYRQKNKNGEIVGGPMYVLENALKMKGLGVFFALVTIFATFGTGCAVQSKAISSILYDNYQIPRWFVGVVIMLFAGFVILGGVKKISNVCEKLVPVMASLYIIGCITIMFINFEFILPAIKMIVTEAFSTKAVGGGIAGYAMIVACRYGIARGLFSNESGLGTAPIIAATAKTRNSCRQALVSMTGTFYDTVIVCAITGIVIVSSKLHFPQKFLGLNDDQLTTTAFGLLPTLGNVILSISISIFAFTTILGWAYYGERCIDYLFGINAIKYYRIIFLGVIVLGSVVDLRLIWSFSDTTNGLMVIPNVISLILMNGVIYKKTKYYLFENRLDEVEN